MKKKLFSLLVLLMVAVTGAWAQEETLLTTITPTGDGTYSETTAGAVTVTPTGSFFYSGSSYGWRWDSYGSLTVTANEGYTITRCVFIQQGKNQSVTISEAPFALNFEEWLCLENTSMDGVTSIEVYGYAPAEPVASWVGNSAINANGTWYYAGSNFGWCTGGAFNGADLGTITTLSLGGQSQAWAEGNANWNDENLTMTMGYKIDGGADESLSLNWCEFADNNNKFQSGGSSWAAQDIDISGLTPGNHTIAVWFTRDDKWDSNNSANYVANFTIPTPAATTYNVTFRANGNTKVVENVTLPHTFSCYYNGNIGVGDGELDLIIQELYGFSGGWCDESSPWMDNAVSGVTVGISSDNQYFSISTPFEGTAQLKGWYYRGWEDDFVYTLDIAIAAVEPEPEPQPAGYAVSLKAETADEGNWTAKAGEGEYQSLPLEGVAEGTQVSLKYAGLKKVKSVKAKKKVAAPAAKAAAEATAEDKGKLIGTDGNIYADVEAATAAGTTAVAKIIYIGTTGDATYNHGLALALTDEASKMAWQDAIDACSAKNTSTPVTGATWLLASQDQWDYMLGTDGAGSHYDLRDGFSSVGGSNLQWNYYYSSTEDDSDSDYAWYYSFAYGIWLHVKKGNNNYVRACLAF